MDIDKLILFLLSVLLSGCFGSLMDIDKLIPVHRNPAVAVCFGSLMDIDKLIPDYVFDVALVVLVL